MGPRGQVHWCRHRPWRPRPGSRGCGPRPAVRALGDTCRRAIVAAAPGGAPRRPQAAGARQASRQVFAGCGPEHLGGQDAVPGSPGRTVVTKYEQTTFPDGLRLEPLGGRCAAPHCAAMPCHAMRRVQRKQNSWAAPCCGCAGCTARGALCYLRTLKGAARWLCTRCPSHSGLRSGVMVISGRVTGTGGARRRAR